MPDDDDDNGGGGTSGGGGGGGSGGGGTSGGGGGGGGGGGSSEKTVPYKRFQELVRQKRELQDKLDALERETQGAVEKAATSDTLAKRVKELEKELTTKSAQWDEERALFQTGFTDEDGVAIARSLHSRLPEKDRPTLGDWLKGIAKDPANAPKGLVPYLPPPPKDGEGEGKGGKGTEGGKGSGSGSGSSSGASGAGKGSGLGSTRGGVKAGGQQGADGEPASAEKIREAYQKAQKTGNWSEYRQLRGFKDPDDKGTNTR